MRIEDDVKLDYCDVLIRPKRSTLESRKDVNLHRTFQFKCGRIWTGVPIAAVFRGLMPETFLGREVVNGDQSDLLNLSQPGKIIGLKAKGPALVPSETNKFFVVDQTNRETFENRFFKQIPLKVAA